MTLYHAAVIDHETPEAAARCLRSLERTDHPPARLVHHRVGVDAPNGGFAHAVNHLAREAHAAGISALLVSNADVLVHPATPGHLLAALAEAPHLSAVAPTLLELAGGRAVESAGTHVGRVTGRVRQREAGRAWRRVARLPHPPEVTPVTFTCVLLNLPAFLALGGLNEDYFLYFEDLAFSLAALRSGNPTAVVPHAVAWHEGSRSPRRLRYAARNHLRLLAGGNPARAALIAASHLVHALAQRRVPAAVAVPAAVRGLLDARRRPTGPLPE